MQSWFFTEDAYPYLPEADTYESIRVNLPNKYYDPDKGADLYHMYLDLWCAADELGLEVMVNEHHQTATCVIPAAPIMLGIKDAADPATLKAAFEAFNHWGNMRGVCQILAFATEVGAMAAASISVQAERASGSLEPATARSSTTSRRKR